MSKDNHVVEAHTAAAQELSRQSEVFDADHLRSETSGAAGLGRRGGFALVVKLASGAERGGVESLVRRHAS